MFEKITGNVFRNYLQCFLKLWAMFFKPTCHAIFKPNITFYSIRKGVVETGLKPETGLRDIA